MMDIFKENSSGIVSTRGEKLTPNEYFDILIQHSTDREGVKKDTPHVVENRIENLKTSRDKLLSKYEGIKAFEKSNEVVDIDRDDLD